MDLLSSVTELRLGGPECYYNIYGLRDLQTVYFCLSKYKKF